MIHLVHSNQTEKLVDALARDLAADRPADDALARLGECDHRRGCARSLCVRDDHGLPAFHDGHAGVRGSKIDTKDAAHAY